MPPSFSLVFNLSNYNIEVDEFQYLKNNGKNDLSKNVTQFLSLYVELYAIMI